MQSAEQLVMTAEASSPGIAEGGFLQGIVSHPSLVEVASKWLGRKCAIVITELGTTSETPDAIGWHGTHSTLQNRATLGVGEE